MTEWTDQELLHLFQICRSFKCQWKSVAENMHLLKSSTSEQRLKYTPQGCQQKYEELIQQKISQQPDLVDEDAAWALESYYCSQRLNDILPTVVSKQIYVIALQKYIEACETLDFSALSNSEVNLIRRIHRVTNRQDVLGSILALSPLPASESEDDTVKTFLMRLNDNMNDTELHGEPSYQLECVTQTDLASLVFQPIIPASDENVPHVAPTDHKTGLHYDLGEFKLLLQTFDETTNEELRKKIAPSENYFVFREQRPTAYEAGKKRPFSSLSNDDVFNFPSKRLLSPKISTPMRNNMCQIIKDEMLSDNEDNLSHSDGAASSQKKFDGEFVATDEETISTHSHDALIATTMEIKSEPVTVTRPVVQVKTDLKRWKRQVVVALTSCFHMKHSSTFLRPVTDDIAPDYSSIVKRPMDLTTLRKLVDQGKIEDTSTFLVEFSRIFANAVMYNTHDAETHLAAVEMYNTAIQVFAPLAAEVDFPLPKVKTHRIHGKVESPVKVPTKN